jgi:hypothetical protein
MNAMKLVWKMESPRFRPMSPSGYGVINTSNQIRSISKGMILGWALPHPAQILAVKGSPINTAEEMVDGTLSTTALPTEEDLTPEMGPNIESN